MKAKPWPPYSSALRNGNRRLQFVDPITGKRRSITDLLPNEPKEGYSTQAAAWAAHELLQKALAENVDYSVSLRGFWELWCDPLRSPWRKGAIDGGRRSEQTFRTHRAQTSKFVELFGHLPMATIKRRPHVQEYLDSDPARTSLTYLALLWRDAASEKGGLPIETNPFAELAKDVAREDAERRDETGILAPLDWQIDLMLSKAHSDPYPIGFALWLEFGQETGLRCGELDAVRFDRVRLVEFEDGSETYVYDVVEQFHAHLKTFAAPKWKSFRTIALSPRALEILEIARPIAAEFGSPYAFNTKDGKHLTDGYRDRYWTGDKTLVGLRTLVDGLQMKNATRHYFATTALREYNRQVLAGEGTIPFALLGEHMGHKDGGETLRKHYAKTYAQDMQMGMNQFFANGRKRSDELAQQRRRRQIRPVDGSEKDRGNG